MKFLVKKQQIDCIERDKLADCLCILSIRV